MFSTREFHSPPPSLPHPPSTSPLAFPPSSSSSSHAPVLARLGTVITRESSSPLSLSLPRRALIAFTTVSPRVFRRVAPDRDPRLACVVVSSRRQSRRSRFKPLERFLASRRESIHRSIDSSMDSRLLDHDKTHARHRHTRRRRSSVATRVYRPTDRPTESFNRIESINQSSIDVPSRHPSVTHHPSRRDDVLSRPSIVVSSLSYLASRRHRARSLDRSIARRAARRRARHPTPVVVVVVVVVRVTQPPRRRSIDRSVSGLDRFDRSGETAIDRSSGRPSISVRGGWVGSVSSRDSSMCLSCAGGHGDVWCLCGVCVVCT